MKPPALVEAIRGYDLDIYRLQNLARVAKARDLVDSEADTQALLKALDQQQLISQVFKRPALWESRFRRAFDAGVYFGCEDLETAMAEVGYHRHKFLLDSPGLKSTCVSLVSVAARLKAQLVDTVLLNDPAIYDKHSYQRSQEVALDIREANIPGLRYLSARSKRSASAFAIFDAQALRPKRSPAKTWSVTITRDRIEFRDLDSVTEFDPGDWA